MSEVLCVKCNSKNSNTASLCAVCGFKLNNVFDKTKFNLDIDPQEKITVLENPGLNIKDNDSQNYVIEYQHDSLNLQSKEPDNFELKQTEQMDISEKIIAQETGETNCIKCGYILSAFSNLCPSCGYNNSIKEKTESLKKTMIYQKTAANHTENTVAISESKTSDISNKTIRDEALVIDENITGAYDEYLPSTPYSKTVREKYSPTAEYKEDIKKNPVRLEALTLNDNADQAAIINFKKNTDKLIINRKKINDDDTTISADKHAVIYKENDEWFIENMASNKAVFLQVKDVSKLKNGDIILFGADKFYIFVDETESEE